MASTLPVAGEIAHAGKRLIQRVLSIGHTRLELLLVEVQEERERMLTAILLALGVAVFSLLAGFALTILAAILLWNYSPVAALSVLFLVYAGAGAFLYIRLTQLRHDRKVLPTTMDQIGKDRECLDRLFH
jgi:uncharacterized membrane protein YqjE